jgi:lysyl-tRNA synthetase class I
MDYKDKEYHRQKSRDHYLKYKEKYDERNKQQKEKTKQTILEHKKSGCMSCKEADPVCLDFHHLDDKDLVVSQMLGYNEERVLKEISKCVVLCANCHRKVHAGVLVLPF